jgi:two-component system, sensor histidine kinase
MISETAGSFLHLDDDLMVRESMAMLLDAEGYVVSSAATGAEAIQLVRDGLRPDVLIVDYDLGEQLSGPEVTQQIRDLLTYAPPIIVLTGDAHRAQFLRAIEVIVWLVSKPLNPQLLLAALPSLVQLSRATRERAEKELFTLLDSRLDPVGP